MRFSILLTVLAASACIRTAPSPVPGYWISSDSSQYSPIARFRVRSTLSPAAVSIAIDSGSLAIPGDPIPNVPPLMSDLYMTAILVVPDSGTLTEVQPNGKRISDRRGWRPLATSDSILVLSQLSYGDRTSFPMLRMNIPLSELPSSPAWLVFRITGNTVEIDAPLTPGGPLRRRDLRGGLQVYVCGASDITGRLDDTRGSSLKKAYGIAC